MDWHWLSNRETTLNVIAVAFVGTFLLILLLATLAGVIGSVIDSLRGDRDLREQLEDLDE